jgi:hypothetical protein
VNHAEVSQINESIVRQQKRPFLLLAASSAQWYQWSTAHPHTRLCTECWTYYKKSGGLKYPKKSGKTHHLQGSQRFEHSFDTLSGPDRRQGTKLDDDVEQ